MPHRLGNESDRPQPPVLHAQDADPRLPARLFLVDGSLYVFRAWQKTALQFDDNGSPCNATEGFATWLGSVLDAAAGAPLVCFFDAHDGNSQRRRIHPAYKADRPPVDPNLLEQIEACRQHCRQLGMPVLTASGGLEADDLIAAVASNAQAAQHPVTIVTGDKDLAQLLVSPRDHWWDAGRREPLDASGVSKRFGVLPEQIPDWLALAGDASDNIKGVPGVGPPTAARLLKRWSDLDTLFAHLPEVASMRFRGAPRVAALLAEHEPSVRQARRLTGPLPADVPALADLIKT